MFIFIFGVISISFHARATSHLLYTNQIKSDQSGMFFVLFCFGFNIFCCTQNKKKDNKNDANVLKNFILILNVVTPRPKRFGVSLRMKEL
jgi:hypothetical protein